MLCCLIYILLLDSHYPTPQDIHVRNLHTAIERPCQNSSCHVPLTFEEVRVTTLNQPIIIIFCCCSYYYYYYYLVLPYKFLNFHFSNQKLCGVLHLIILIYLKIGGYAVGYQNLTFVTVLGAGHAIGSYQPAKVFTLFSSFIDGKLPPSIPLF